MKTKPWNHIFLIFLRYFHITEKLMNRFLFLLSQIWGPGIVQLKYQRTKRLKFFFLNLQRFKVHQNRAIFHSKCKNVPYKCSIFKVLNLKKENFNGSALWYFSCSNGIQWGNLLVPRTRDHLSSFKCGFLLRWNKYGAKNAWKTTFHSTSEMIQL